MIIDLGKRYVAAFGFISSNQGDSLNATGFSNAVNNAEVFVTDGRSSFEEFTLKHDDVVLKFGYMDFIKNDANVFAPPPIVTFRHGKRIGETIVNSNDSEGTELEFGQVVEMYGRKPVSISIQGLLIDMDNHKYPGDKIRKLVDEFYYNGIWEVEGKIFRDNRIRSIYFSGDLELSGVQGFEDTWQFTLEAMSIKPVEFFLKPKQ